MKKSFYEKKSFSYSNFIFSLIQCSLYFLICNIPLLFFIIVTSIYPNAFSFIALYVCLIPFGPALGSLYYSSSKAISEKDMFFGSRYWKYYKKNFISFLRVWITILSFILIFSIDYEYFYINMNEKPFYIIFLILNIIVATIGLYALAINSYFTFKFKDIFLLSVFYMVKKLPITIMKIIIIAFSLFLINNVNLILSVFLPVLLCLVFFYFDRFFLQEIKNRFTINSNDSTNEDNYIQ